MPTLDSERSVANECSHASLCTALLSVFPRDFVRRTLKSSEVSLPMYNYCMLPCYTIIIGKHEEYGIW